MKHHISKYGFRILVLFFCNPFIVSAQEQVKASSTTVFSNALFNTLLILILILLIIIVALGQALKNIAGSDYVLNKFKAKEHPDKNNSGIKVSIILFFLTAVYQMQAQEANKSNDNWLIGGLDMFTFYSMLTAIFLEAILVIILYRLIMGFIKTEKSITYQPKKSKTILEKINASVDIEKEHDIMLGHEYDGIKELDNDLPPWWKYGFYLTIFIGVIYLLNFHVLRTGDLQTAEYNQSIEQARLDLEEYMKTSANNVDETTVKQLEASDVSIGKEIFIANCAACHGQNGQGTVGPNLTDNYWLHGGSIADVFKSIKYGWVDKGMKSWKEDLSPMQIAQIASFIKTLRGTNPAGAKEPQGDLDKENNLNPADSASITADSLVIQKDTLK